MAGANTVVGDVAPVIDPDATWAALRVLRAAPASPWVVMAEFETTSSVQVTASVTAPAVASARMPVRWRHARRVAGAAAPPPIRYVPAAGGVTSVVVLPVTLTSR